MTLLTVHNLSKRFDDRTLFSNIGLVVDDEERIGLVGPNGCGKSTLLRILAGVEESDEGERSTRRGLTIGYLEQDPVLDSSLSIRDAVHAGLTGRLQVIAELQRIHQEFERADLLPSHIESLLRRQSLLEEELEKLGGHDVEHQIESVLEHLGLHDQELRCATLSGGEKRRVALARLLISKPDLLLLDEPTNHLDALCTEWLEDHLLDSRVPFVMVTHDRYLLDRVVHRIVEISGSELRSYDGGYGDYVVASSQRMEADRRVEKNRQSLLRRETQWMRRGPPARTTKAKARIGRYRSLVDSGPEPDAQDLSFHIPAGPRLGTRVLRLEQVTKAFASRTLFSNLDVELGQQMRLGIVGPNGAGKSTLLKIFMRQIAPDAGIVDVGDTVKFACIDQNRSALHPEKSVVEEVASGVDSLRFGERSVRVETFLEQFLFPGTMKLMKVAKLSGGEKNRVLLAKLLLQRGNVLVLDEPTNDLDLMSLRVLEEALIAFPGSALVVSHDRYFLDRVATHILFLDGLGGARRAVGDWSSLQARMAAEVQIAKSGVPPKREDPPSVPKTRRRTFLEQREYDALPEQISGLESTMAKLDAQLSDPSLYSEPKARLEHTLLLRRQTLEQIEKLYRRWEELE